jgi:hypothetical protein
LYTGESSAETGERLPDTNISTATDNKTVSPESDFMQLNLASPEVLILVPPEFFCAPE